MKSQVRAHKRIRSGPTAAEAMDLKRCAEVEQTTGSTEKPKSSQTMGIRNRQ